MNDAYQQMAVDAISHAANMAREEVRIIAAEYARPSVVWKPKLYVDGNQWCALLGDNLQDGVAGFGDSPAEAMWDFDKQWFAKLPTIEGVPEKKTDQKGQQ
jgi:hypothetical protein